MNELGATELSALQQELWRKEVQDARYSQAVHQQVVFVVEKELTRRGDIVHLPVFPRLTTNTVGATNGTVTNQSVTLTDNTITVSTHREITVEVLDAEGWQTTFGSSEAMARAFGKQYGARLAEYIDNDIFGLHGSITTNVVGNIAGTISLMNPGMARAALQKLDEQRIPKKDRAFILSPKAFWELFGTDNMSLAYATGLSKGVQVTGPEQVPALYGARFFESPEVAVSGQLDKNLLLHKETIGLVLQINSQIVQLAKIALTTRLTGHTLYGRGVLRETHGCVINTQT